MLEGVEEPVGWYKGVPGGTVRRYSDVLLMFLLKALRPEKYRERVEVRGSLASIDLNRLTDEQLRRISAGEQPWSVLGSALDRGLPRGPALGLPAASEEHGGVKGGDAPHRQGE